MVTARLAFRGRLVFFYFNYFTTLILPAVGANGVRQAFLATVGAGGEVHGLHSIVGTAAVAATFRMFTLWMWGHALLLDMIAIRALKRADYSHAGRFCQVRDGGGLCTKGGDVLYQQAERIRI
jgi:hypothetical protein